MNNARNNQIIRNSTSGNRERIQKQRKKVSSKQKSRRIVAGILACMAIGGVTVTGVEALATKIENNSILSDARTDFHTTFISPNSKRSIDTRYYYYEYQKIANQLEESKENLSKNIYLSYADLGEEQTNKILDCTEYDNLDNFLNQNGISKEDWIKQEKEKIILNHEIEEKQKDLAEMNKFTEQTSEDTDGKGVK